jgi:hypothetical protein
MCYDYCKKVKMRTLNITLLNKVRPKEQGQRLISKKTILIC